MFWGTRATNFSIYTTKMEGAGPKILGIGAKFKQVPCQKKLSCKPGFGFASHWLKNWRESFKPITKRSNRNHVITFDSHLKTALCSKGDF